MGEFIAMKYLYKNETIEETAAGAKTITEIVLDTNEDYVVSVLENNKIQIVLGNEAASSSNSKTTGKTINEIRQWILDRYNWNGIVKLMKSVSTEIDDFTYQVPSNLEGNTSDDSRILPDAAIIAIIKAQLNKQIESQGSPTAANYSAILNNIGIGSSTTSSGFVTSFTDETSEFTLMDESSNDNSTLSNGTQLVVPNFETAAEEEVYNYAKALVGLKNGLWSNNTGVVNLVGLRRVLETTSAKFNDSIVVCWKSTEANGTTIKHAAVYVATSEQGHLTVDRGMVPQTLQMNLGYHWGRQPGGRSNHLLIKSASGTYDFDKKSSTAGMNFHNGGSNIQVGGMSADKLVSYRDADTPEKVELAKKYIDLFSLLSEWGTTSSEKTYSELEKVTNMDPYEVKSSTSESVVVGKIQSENAAEWKTIDISTAIDWMASTYSGSEEKAEALSNIINPLDSQSAVLNGGPIGGFTEEQIKEFVTAQEVELIIIEQLTYMSKLSQIDGRPGNNYINLMGANPEKITDMISRAESDKTSVDNLLTDLGSSQQNYVKDLKFDTKDERTKLGSGTGNLAQQNTDNSKKINSNVGNWSDGCQVVYGAEQFYDMMSKITANIEATGQTRWYYTLVNVESN
ncbi:MAG: hypothetical protein ACJASQ_000517 [Crocinitomicaceae bacterium]|jgi:hypothetical protein